MDLRETRRQWQEARRAVEDAQCARLAERVMTALKGPGVPMYDPSLGRIVYVPVDWPERKPKL